MNIKRRKMKQFSIIIATYNAAETLNACLNSIRSQKAEEVELIVVDGNSADATHEIVQENMDIIDIYIHEKTKEFMMLGIKVLRLPVENGSCL